MKTFFSCHSIISKYRMKFTALTILFMAIAQTLGMEIVKIRDVTLRNNSAVEVLGTDVDELDDFTMCGRFWNPYLATTLDIWQNMVYIKANDMWLLAKVAILDCDNRYEGCNDYYRKVLGRLLVTRITTLLTQGLVLLMLD